ncbi:50S ribosomal protein L33 [endosymbiont of Euscepes postfasciatus]|uniref:50S ribosomal protein L33 n=1 Tax=endosymbiont of Euscepes postfasciatus TaxID=650377 RepID=UPI000DC71D4F|nr:50S ribosomal protein L33 [endosymbiont of Euscepes postfasciatus]BBA84582.1 50S ribosomal protein L33 [endosymbiont of Euscepes postfasciatus]
MSKKNKKIIKLISTQSKHFYIKKKCNKSKILNLSLKKFDPNIRKHILYILEK